MLKLQKLENRACGLVWEAESSYIFHFI